MDAIEQYVEALHKVAPQGTLQPNAVHTCPLPNPVVRSKEYHLRPEEDWLLNIPFYSNWTCDCGLRYQLMSESTWSTGSLNVVPAWAPIETAPRKWGSDLKSDFWWTAMFLLVALIFVSMGMLLEPGMFFIAAVVGLVCSIGVAVLVFHLWFRQHNKPRETPGKPVRRYGVVGKTVETARKTPECELLERGLA